MKPALPLCCTPDAFNLMARQADAIESSDALVYAATAISMHQLENLDPETIDATLQGYVDAVRSRVRGSQQQAIFAQLHEVIFEEEKFVGNAEDYYNAFNSYLPEVLRSKRGLPITLSLIYKTVAERLGLRAWGVGLPGHFLVGVEMDGKMALIDPFAGGTLITVEEAHSRLLEMLGPDVEWSDELLAPVSNRLWITRILQNLLHTFGNAGQFADVAAVLEMEMLLWPKRDQLQRDLALVLARCGLSQPASLWLTQYLNNNPDDPQHEDLAQLLGILKEQNAQLLEGWPTHESFAPPAPSAPAAASRRKSGKHEPRG